MNSFFLWLYRISPKIFISKCTWLLARIPLFYPLNILVFRIYIWWYSVDLQDVEHPLSHFHSVNQFFIRKLKPDSRPFPSDPHILGSPVEGFVSCFGPILQDHQLLQAKGKSYSLNDLLENSSKVTPYLQGFYVTIYLSPKDYHRIHTPLETQISFFQYIPGTLFPVNTLAVRSIENLFPRNERLITYLSTTEFGEIALVKVGAMNVGRIALAYHSFQSNRFFRRPFQQTFSSLISLKKGEEVGRFELGSTIILLFPHQNIQMHFQEGQPIRLGEALLSLKK